MKLGVVCDAKHHWAECRAPAGISNARSGRALRRIVRRFLTACTHFDGTEGEEVMHPVVNSGAIAS